MRINKFVVKVKLNLWEEEEYLYIGEEGYTLVDNLDEAIKVDTEDLARRLLRSFKKRNFFEERDFVIIKIPILTKDGEEEAI